jgi:RimJ/RimL family protein N-acetyltransferase
MPGLSSKTSQISPTWYRLLSSASGVQHIPLPASNSRPPTFLTPFYPTDAEALHRTFNHPLVNNVLISVPKPYTLKDANFWIGLQLSGSKDSSLLLQALRTENPDSGRFIGAVSLTPMPSQAVPSLPGQIAGSPPAPDWYELGYYLHPDYQGKGTMKDAVRADLA